jgi:hypothetical protein
VRTPGAAPNLSSVRVAGWTRWTHGTLGVFLPVTSRQVLQLYILLILRSQIQMNGQLLYEDFTEFLSDFVTTPNHWIQLDPGPSCWEPVEVKN